MAQALQAASATVDPDFVAHSLRAYFIRRGDHTEPVRYEVDRIRNGRSFCTRRVVARQSVGAILNLEASFQAPEQAGRHRDGVVAARPPAARRPGADAWTPVFERRFIPAAAMDLAGRARCRRAAAWLRVAEDAG